jgi:hypothetical protein
MERQKSKELFDSIEQVSDAEYHKRISKGFMLSEACKLRH